MSSKMIICEIISVIKKAKKNKDVNLDHWMKL